MVFTRTLLAAKNLTGTSCANVTWRQKLEGTSFAPKQQPVLCRQSKKPTLHLLKRPRLTPLMLAHTDNQTTSQSSQVRGRPCNQTEAASTHVGSVGPASTPQPVPGWCGQPITPKCLSLPVKSLSTWHLLERY